MKQRAIKPKFYIYCNGKIAEPTYFKEYKDYLHSRTITVNYKRFKQLSPWKLINKVATEKKALIKRGDFAKEDRDQCWCVFDVDEFWDQNPREFKTAVKLAHKNSICLAWSNRCFELWYLLHFQTLQTATDPKDYDTKLKKHFLKLGNKKYTKNCSVFAEILDKQPEAIKNAKQIFKPKKVDKNPSTTVFKLVGEINKHLGQNSL